MKNICIVVEYDGTDFSGFQKQPGDNLRTVQGEIEKALEEITESPVKINGSGRTDAGVSAAEQYINFFTEAEIPPEKYRFALNTKLPPDISVYKSFEVPQKFHARYSATKRTYRYRILNSPVRSSLRRNTTFHFQPELDYQSMRKAWLTLRGKHDFRAFCKSDTDRVIMTCSIFNTWCERTEDELIFYVTSDTFLRGMVRFLIGTLVKIGQNRLTPEDLMEIVESKDRKRVTLAVSGSGLSLIRVDYPPEAFILE